MDDPIGDTLHSRRIPHSRQGKSKSAKGGHASKPFDPLKSLGRYTVHVGSRNASASKSSRPDDAASWMEVHELTAGEDGLVATFNLQEKLSGVLILAGSRKRLAVIIDEFESTSSKEDQDQSSGEGNAELSADEEDSTLTRQSALEIEDERINRRANAFEKNSFRNPKFWLRWQGRLLGSEAGEHAEEPLENGTGYVIFSSNDCKRFEGTMSCVKLRWDNVKIQGWKIHSRATSCRQSWTAAPNS